MYDLMTVYACYLAIIAGLGETYLIVQPFVCAAANWNLSPHRRQARTAPKEVTTLRVLCESSYKPDNLYLYANAVRQKAKLPKNRSFLYVVRAVSMEKPDVEYLNEPTTWSVLTSVMRNRACFCT